MTVMKIIDSLGNNGSVVYAPTSNSLVRIVAKSGASICKLGSEQVSFSGSLEVFVGNGDQLAIYAGASGGAVLITAQENIP